MKPRFRSADLTQEDWLAWLHARHGFHEIPWLQLIDAYEAADRRDADLMYAAQLYEWASSFVPGPGGWSHVLLRGRGQIAVFSGKKRSTH